MAEIGIPWPELNDGLFYTDIVKSTPAPPTLIEFYCSLYQSSAPRKGWLQRIHNGQIAIDGKVVTVPDTLLRVGSKLVYHRLPWKEPSAPYKLHVLFEDDEVLAVNKPSGLQVLPGGLFQQRTVLMQLQWRNNRSNQHGPVVAKSDSSSKDLQPVPVHRLGRGTSGVLLCAKSHLAKSRLATDFAEGTSFVKSNSDIEMEFDGRKRRISKSYRALAKGIIQQDKIIVKQPIGKVQYPGVGSGLYVASATGKSAESIIRVLNRDENNNCTLVEVEIYSGRPHQIRIHLSYIGHPLIGDPLYIVGGRPSISIFESYKIENFAEDGGYERPLNPVPGDCGYFLHAYRLIFHHPATDEVIEIYAPPPPMLCTSSEQSSVV